jgi:hypothetical protein
MTSDEKAENLMKEIKKAYKDYKSGKWTASGLQSQLKGLCQTELEDDDILTAIKYIDIFEGGCKRYKMVKDPLTWELEKECVGNDFGYWCEKLSEKSEKTISYFLNNYRPFHENTRGEEAAIVRAKLKELKNKDK